MPNIMDKLPKEVAQQLRKMIEAKAPTTQMSDYIYSNLTSEQTKALGFSRTQLYNYVLECRKNLQSAPQGKNQEPKPAATTSGSPNSPDSKDEEGPETPPEIDTSGNSSPALSDEAEDLPGIDLEFASIGIPELQGMILKKESFKALRRLIIANNRPRKAMSAAKMHLPSRLARTDKMLESCVDQTYLAIAALQGGQTELARILLNNMAANLEVERRSAIVEALGVEDAATDISRDSRTDLFSFEERERLPSFRDQQKSRKSQTKKAKAKPNTDRSFRPPPDPKNGKKTSGGDRKDGRPQPRE